MQERTIFLTALEFKTPEARAAFLDEQCAQDAALRRRIEALLKAHEQQGGVVDAMIGSNEPTSSMHSLKEDAPPQPAVDPEDLNFLGPSTTPGCLGSLGPYEVIEVIGRGGMGLVFKARDTKLQRIVAIKVLAPEIAANKTAKKRFEREAQAAAAVSHDHIVTIHAVDEFNNLPYLVMECIVGHSLQQKIEETGPLELKEILRIGMQAALGLAAAHKQGLVHRDIKPANILLQNGIQRVKITDFGLARATDDVGMTHTGQIAGTPMYMSPEQAQGQRVDHLSDLFSLGSVLYTMCTGRPAFRAPNTVAVLRRVCDDAPRPILEVNSELPDWLIAIVNKLLSKKKEDRYQTAAEVAELLSEHLSRLQEPRSGQMVTPPSSLLKNVAWTARPSENQLESDGRGVHPTVFQQAATASVAAVVRDTVRPQSPALLSGTVPPRRKWLLAAVGAVALVMLGVIIITITNKDGTKTKIEVPGDAKVEVTTDKASGGRKPPGSSPVGNTLKAPEGLRPPLAKTGWHGWPTDAPPPAIAPFDAEQAKQHQEAWAKYLGVPVEYTNTLGMKFRLIPPGEFSMGSTPEEVEEAIGRLEPYEKNRWTEYIQGEAPQHKVILTQAIYLGMHEVRQANYKQVMGNNPSHFTTTGPDKLLVEKVVGMDTTQHPVEGVNWSDVTEFCTKLGQREKLKPLDNQTDETFHPLTGTGYRLPTEAEWEFACRAGTSTRFWSGEKDEDLARAGWCMRSSDERTHPVGELQANPFGLFDVHGNVWEWMQDWWDPTYYGQFSEKPAIAPSGPSSAGTQRVIRGGFWNSYIPHCRAASRNSQEPRWGGHDIGFRVVLSLDAVRQALKLTGPTMPKAVATTPVPASDFAADRRAAEYVLSIGGSITVRLNEQDRLCKFTTDLPRDPFRLTQVDLKNNQQLSDAGLANFKDCMNLTLLFLGNTKVSDAGLAHFKDCKNLTQLYLSDTQVSDVGLDQFKGRQNLTYLRLAGTRVSDAGLANFKDCKDLMLLKLGSPQVSDAGLAHFKGCKNLGYLGLINTKVTDAGLANFKDCTNLAWLGLDNTQVTNAGIAHFTDWENLAELHLSSAQISDAGLAHLKDCKNLAHLFLAGAQVSDAGLAHLKGCKNLTWLVLLQTKVTAAGIDDLKKALPKCKIEWDGGVIEPTAAARFTNTLGMEFVLVGKGTAWLGGDNGQQGKKKVEMPEDFYLGRYEVTQAEWEQVTGQTPSHFSRTGAVAKTR